MNTLTRVRRDTVPKYDDARGNLAAGRNPVAKHIDRADSRVGVASTGRQRSRMPDPCRKPTSQISVASDRFDTIPKDHVSQ